MSDGFLPLQPVLLRRVDDAVAQALDVVAGEDQLDGGEERADELRLLVADGLPDALGDRDLGALQLERRQRDAVDVEHDVRALGVLPETVTSSATAKWLASGFSQSISQTVSVCSPTPGLTFTP